MSNLLEAKAEDNAAAEMVDAFLRQHGLTQDPSKPDRWIDPAGRSVHLVSLIRAWLRAGQRQPKTRNGAQEGVIADRSGGSAPAVNDAPKRPEPSLPTSTTTPMPRVV